MRTKHLSWIAAVGLTLAGCSQVPQADVDAAKQALADARQAQAEVYAPESWNAAQDASAKLDAELEAQKQHWAALRSYTIAKQLATEAKSSADRSRDDAAQGKERVKGEATTLMSQARDEAAKAHTAVAAAPKGKGTEADLASLKSDASSIDDTLGEAQKAFDSGDYIAAKTKAQAAIDASKKIETEIDQARTARRRA